MLVPRSKICFVLTCLLIVVEAQYRKDLFRFTNVIDDPHAVKQKWDQMEKGMKETVQNILKTYLPRVVETSDTVNISTGCSRDLVKLTSGMRGLKLWAFRFLDASSKGIDGMLDASFASLGNFDECVNNEVIEERYGKNKGKVMFRGKYCHVRMKPYLPPKPKIVKENTKLEPLSNFTTKDTVIGYMARNSVFMYYGASDLGICVPSGCTENDINQILRQALENTAMDVDVRDCTVKEEEVYTTKAIIAIIILSFTGFLVFIGTALHTYAYYRKKECESTCSRVLRAFSFISNFDKLTDTSKASDYFSCLYGMKVITTFWIILSHSYFAMLLIMHNGTEVLKYMKQVTYQLIINGSVGVDTFFVITGVLTCHSFTKSVIIDKKPFSITRHILHRVWRLVPVYAFVILFVFIMPLTGSGPEFHRFLDTTVQSCEKNWWANLLFINNYYDVDNVCITQAWYVALDMQYHIAALLILLLLPKWPKFAITLSVIIIILSMIGSWLSIYLYELVPLYGFTIDLGLVTDMYVHYYILPHTHVGPYLIGLLCGYVLAMRPKFKIPMVVKIIGWNVAVPCALLILYGGRKWNASVEPTFWETVFFSSCHRVGWALCVAWVIICCCTGNAGIANYIMSWKIFVPLGRLSFSVYLIHPVVITEYISTVRSEVIGDHRTAVWMYCGFLILGYLFAFGGHMLAEAPFMYLENIVFSKNKKKEIPVDHSHEIIKDEHGDIFSGKKSILPGFGDKGKDIEANNGVVSTGYVYKP